MVFVIIYFLLKESTIMAKPLTGIYKLSFKNTTKVYIGQAVDINRRYVDHLYTLRKGIASKKLQNAFNDYGTPELEVLSVCSKAELNDLESEAMEIFDSINNGFNSIIHTSTKILDKNYIEVSGQSAPNAKYSNDQYEKVLDLLILDIYSHREISEVLGVSLSVVRSISSLSNHKWLKELHPEKYSKLEKLQEDYSHSTANTAEKRGIVYPNLIAPDGSIHKVTHLRQFARDHGMHSSNLDSLLQGKLKSLLGWTVEGTKLREYPRLVSPDGKIFSIKIGEARQFAKEHNMTPGNLSMLLSGKKDNYKGWTIERSDE